MFYNPRVSVIDNIPVIVYPSKGAEKVFDRREAGCVEGHLRTLYDIHCKSLPPNMQFFIAIAWDHARSSENPDQMIDLWSYADLDGASGAQAYERTFRGLERETTVGECCENAFAMLGRESEHRRGKGLREYLEARPQLPEWLRIGEDFYF